MEGVVTFEKSLSSGDFGFVDRPLTRAELRTIARTARSVGAAASALLYPEGLRRQPQVLLNIDAPGHDSFTEWDGEQHYRSAAVALLAVLEMAGYDVTLAGSRATEHRYYAKAEHDWYDEVEALATVSSDRMEWAAAGLVLWLSERLSPWPRGGTTE